MLLKQTNPDAETNSAAVKGRDDLHTMYKTGITRNLVWWNLEICFWTTSYKFQSWKISV